MFFSIPKLIPSKNTNSTNDYDWSISGIVTPKDKTRSQTSLLIKKSSLFHNLCLGLSLSWYQKKEPFVPG